MKQDDDEYLKCKYSSSYMNGLKEIIWNCDGDRRIAAKIILAETYLVDNKQDEKKGFKILDEIINDKNKYKYQSLCYGLKLHTDEYMKGYYVNHYDAELDKFVQTHPEFYLQGQMYKFDHRFYASSPLSANKDLVSKECFDLLMKQDIRNISCENNPYLVVEAYKAASNVLGDSLKLKCLRMLLDNLNDMNDPSWKNINIRALTCGEIATIYYEHDDYERAQVYIKMGKTYGVDLQTGYIEQAIDVENKRLMLKRE